MAPKNDITIENARIIFRNFAGEERLFNDEGKRNFTVVLDEELGAQMERDGWNVKRLKPREENEEGDLALKVTVSFKGRPPRLVMITSRGRTVLDEESATLLDWAELESVDVILNPYNWDVSGKQGTTAYLKTIYAIIREDDLERKYAHIQDADNQKPDPDRSFEDEEG
jgi:hypothetical protein